MVSQSLFLRKMRTPVITRPTLTFLTSYDTIDVGASRFVSARRRSVVAKACTTQSGALVPKIIVTVQVEST
jgi:hypothetical protein